METIHKAPGPLEILFFSTCDQPRKRYYNFQTVVKLWCRQFKGSTFPAL